MNCNIRMLDTADIYVQGRVESLIGEMLEGAPVTIITKAGNIRYPQSRRAAN